MSDAEFTINLLGSPEILLHGQPLTFATRKTVALLVYLVCEPGQQRRERLATLFWPTVDYGRGRTSLRRALAYLRAGLRDERPLLVDEETLAFNTTFPLHLDLATLQTALAQMPLAALTHAERGDQIAALQGVTPLLRGEFMADFSLEDAPEFDLWLHTQRQRWLRQSHLLLDRLTQWQLASGDWQAALHNAYHWQRLDPLAEAVYQRQMQAYLMAGDPARAQAVYETCCTLLEHEFDAKPAPATQALAAQISKRRAHPAPVNNAAANQPAAQTVDLRHALTMPFVGRTEQFAWLVAALERCRGGQTEICLLEGGTGMGKSRLAAAFLSWAGQQGGDLLQCRTFEMGGRVAYQPLIEALQARLSRENAPDDLLSDLWLGELSRLLPDLRERYPDLPPVSVGNEAEAQMRLFEAVARLGEALAKRKPVLWWIDDLQWVDQASLDLLHFVSRRWAQAKAAILLLFTARAEAHHDLALQQWLTGCARDLPVRRIAVGPLSAAQTDEWLRMLAGRPPTPASLPIAPDPLAEFSRRLQQETAGQPFFIAEMLKSLAEQGAIQVGSIVDGQPVVDFGLVQGKLDQLATLVPTRVRDLMRARLARLSSPATTLLNAGAVLGQHLRFAHARALMELGEDETLLALEELLAAQIFIETADANPLDEPRYLFAHDKLRILVYEGIGHTRRRVLHRRALEVLQQANAPAAALAHHALAAGLPLPAFSYQLLAGDEALRLFALRQATTHYRQAQSLFQEAAVAAQLSQAQQSHLHLQLGRAYELNNEWGAATIVYQELQQLAQQQGWPSVECTALNRLATLLIRQPQTHEQALVLLQQARRLAEQEENQVGLTETVWNLAQLYMYLDRPEALSLGEEAVALARQLADPALLARSLNVLAHAYQNRGRWAAIIPLAEEARQLFGKLGDQALEAEQMTLLTLEYCNMGQLAQSITVGRQALTLTTAIDNQWGQAFAAFALAIALQEAGQVAEALQLARRSVELIAPLAIPPVHIVCLAALAISQIAAGQLAEAELTLISAETMNAANGDMIGNRELFASYRCRSAVHQARWAEAYQHALRASAARGAAPSLSAVLPFWSEVAALLHAGDVAQAEQELQRLEQWAANSPRLQLGFLQAQLVMLEWAGKSAAAADTRQQALLLAEQIGAELVKEQMS
jgi:DNA-binding SARP family transcriptional activator